MYPMKKYQSIGQYRQSECKTGTRSLQLTSEVSNQFCSWYQEVSLRKGATYTFSMYMKAVISEIGENGRCFARVEYHDKDGKMSMR